MPATSPRVRYPPPLICGDTSRQPPPPSVLNSSRGPTAGTVIVSSITASLKVSLIGDGSGDTDGDDAERICPLPRAYSVEFDGEVMCISDGRDPPPIAIEVDFEGVGGPSELGRGCRCWYRLDEGLDADWSRRDIGSGEALRTSAGKPYGEVVEAFRGCVYGCIVGGVGILFVRTCGLLYELGGGCCWLCEPGKANAWPGVLDEGGCRPRLREAGATCCTYPCPCPGTLDAGDGGIDDMGVANALSAPECPCVEEDDVCEAMDGRVVMLLEAATTVALFFRVVGAAYAWAFGGKYESVVCPRSCDDCAGPGDCTCARTVACRVVVPGAPPYCCTVAFLSLLSFLSFLAHPFEPLGVGATR